MAPVAKAQLVWIAPSIHNQDHRMRMITSRVEMGATGTEIGATIHVAINVRYKYSL